jgi:hypothetical protein
MFWISEKYQEKHCHQCLAGLAEEIQKLTIPTLSSKTFASKG